ncbi:MAG: hypothetical protein IT318_15135 [Anaerolineales bacterium]|nr:hypothetical protein [Anaerolineales bacterium]
MGARRGQDYINKLRGEPRNINHRTEKAEDVTAHPAFRLAAKHILAL